MSGPDFAARGLARNAQAANPVLFSQLATRHIPANIERIETSGYLEVGRGASTYISDALCDAELLTAHPNFTIKTANNRIFRLLPLNGYILVEQGGATGQSGVNDQPAIQAAIDYAEAVGAAEVHFGQSFYELWCPERISPYKNIHATDGHPIIIRKTLILRGTAAQRSTLDFKGLGGVDPETSWQNIPFDTNNPSDAVWRGGAVFVLGDTGPAPAELNIEQVELHRLIFTGNRLHTGDHQWPADPIDGDGWDGSDKGFWVQDTHIGDIVMMDTDFIGWKGELLYLVGADPRSLTMERVKLLTTNGTAFNPGVNVPLTVSNCEFGDAFQAQEDTGKRSARYINCLWRDCDRMNIGSGPTDGVLYHYLYPTRDLTTQPPITQLDACEFRNIGQLRIGNWVRGRIRTTDTLLNLTANLFMQLQDIDLEVDAWLDQKNFINPVVLYGPANLTTQINGAPAGEYIKPPTNVHLRLRHFRTRNARDNGRQWKPIQWGGYIEKTCRIIVEGGEFNKAPSPDSLPARSMPFIQLRDYQHTTNYIPHGAVNMAPINADITITPFSPMTLLNVGSETTHNVTLTKNPTGGNSYGYAEGQKVRFYKSGDQGAARFVKGASANVAMSQTRKLDNDHDWIEFTFNQTAERWEESGFYSTVSNTLEATLGAQDIPSVAAGATENIDIVLPGAAPGDLAQASLSIPMGGLLASAQVDAADHISLTLYNPTPAAIDLGVCDIKVHASK